MYITEETKATILRQKPGTVVLMNAPVGSGKTTFCIEELWTHCRVNHVAMLLMVNRSALRGQLRRGILERVHIQESCIAEESILEVDGLTIISYQYFQQLLMHKNDLNSLKIGAMNASDFAYIVADEIHYLYVDSLFSPTTGYLLQLPRIFPKAVRIYMSATLEPVRDIILDMEEVFDRYNVCSCEFEKRLLSFRYEQTGIRAQRAKCEWELKREVIEIQAAEPDFSYFAPVILAEDTDLIQLIIKKRVEKDLGKWLIFVDSKDQGKSMKAALRANGVRASFVAADGMEDDDMREMEEILGKNKFKADILLATPVLDNGVSIVDTAVTHVVISGFEVIQAVQQAGRIRVRKSRKPISLYIFRRSAEYFNRRAYQLREKMQIIRAFSQNNQMKILDYVMKNGNEGCMQVLYQDAAGEWRLNPLAEPAAKYFLEELMEYKSLLQSDLDGGVKKVLSWFDLPYNSECDLLKQRQIEARENLRVSLEKKLDMPISGEVWDEFRRQLREMYEKATGIILCSGHSDRLIGTAKIKCILHEFNYFLEGKNKVYIIRKGGEKPNVSDCV